MHPLTFTPPLYIYKPVGYSSLRSGDKLIKYYQSMEGYKKFMIVGLVVVMIGMNIGSGPVLVNGFCRMSNAGLKSCLPSVSGDNPVDPPAPACCSAIANADLPCFCRYKDSGLLAFYGVDPNQAMALPVKCKVVDPSYHC